MLVASNGSFQPPKTELNIGDRENSIDRGVISPQQTNGRYDIQSNNEKMSLIDKSNEVSNVKLSKQINSSNDITGKDNTINEGGSKKKSS